MTSLSKRLAQLQEEIKKESARDERQEIDQLNLAQLKNMPVPFGKAKLGSTYEEAFQDQSWTKWFVSHYENCQKPERLKFLRFVNLRRRLSEGSAVKGQTKNKTDTYSCPAASGVGVSSMALPVETPWDAEEHPLEEILAHQEHQDLRMIRVENALTQIIQHLEQRGFTALEPQGPWMMVKEEPK